MTAPENYLEFPQPSQNTLAIHLMTQAMQSQTAAIIQQTAAMRELAASNRMLAKAMLDDDGDDDEGSDCYLDGTPKHG